jgi:hypothetical protein
MPKGFLFVKAILMARCARQAQGTGHRAQGKKIKESLSSPCAFSLIRFLANFFSIFPLKVKKVNFCT